MFRSRKYSLSSIPSAHPVSRAISNRRLGLGHHDGFTSSHTTIKLVLSSSSKNPNAISTRLSDFGTESAVTFSSNTSPGLVCLLAALLVVAILDVQNLSNTACSYSKKQSRMSSLMKGLYAILRSRISNSAIFTGLRQCSPGFFCELQLLVRESPYFVISFIGSSSTGSFMFTRIGLI